MVGEIPRILRDGLGPQAPVRGTNLVGKLEALDAYPVDVLVLAIKSNRIGDDEFDQVVYVVAEGAQGDELTGAELLMQSDFVLGEFSGSRSGLPPNPKRSVLSGARKAVPAEKISRVRVATSSPYSAFQVVSPPNVSWSVY